ncbi:Apocarotenoid-15,15'-oxygenase [Tetrabaena socialis]|uniref:Apocarotenoid-15,15'-oxygenase n=1 Tax=Tetrabaena socialis TaxID=47790 RepID=A0A2J8A6H3_9CHLO|nr:Apocarotenoid-15,15'-oxygenase [Tetrabaena socialis]|eukprot:PNH08097.1 Apocarotenoid-15,15'-oxygenase [Tetrabaena socialis]
MDPLTLATVGESSMGGALKEGGTFAAHYRVVSSEADGGRRWVSFSSSTGFGGAALTFYEFGEDGRKLHETTHALENTSMVFVHDMLVSEHYYIVLLGPIDFDPKKFATQYVLSKCSIAECLVYDRNKPARVVLAPRPGRPSGKVLAPRSLPTDPCFAFHHVNAFEVRPGP